MRSTNPILEIRAPLSGVVVPLESVPDPVFARRMAGDGVAIDPTSSEVLAPVSGQVTQLHAGHHAVAITTESGVEVLVHVGLDTVALQGRGFTALVTEGARVERGEPLIRFDADEIARNARSLLSVVLVPSVDRVARMAAASGLVEAGADMLLRLETKAPEAGEAREPAESVLSEAVRLPNALGLHARPAAVLANEARRYAGPILLVRGADEANAKSVVAVMGLSTRKGETVRIKASGPGAKVAAGELAKLLASGCGESLVEAPREAVWPGPTPPVRKPTVSQRELSGAPASPGLAIGRVFQYRHVTIDVQETGGTEAEERKRLEGSRAEAARQIEALKRHAFERSKAQILDVHLSLLDDPDLLEQTEALLRHGKSAAFAWREAFNAHASRLEHLDNPLLRERAADVRDVGRRVLALITGFTETPIDIPEGSILIAEELTPSDAARFERDKLLGFCTTTGGSTSHLAIIARSMGIPAVCGIDEAALAIPDGTRVAIDGGHGLLRISPDETYAKRLQERIARQKEQALAEQAAAFTIGRTRDGHRVEVVANIRNAKDAREAMAAGAEGVGLLRSEFLFGERESPPSEDEQAETYATVAGILGARPLVIRTLDVGGDKPLSYLPLPKEDNPFLGLRGIRVSLEHPDLFRTQLRAILRAAPTGNMHVMFPMVATLDDLRAAKEILAEEQRSIPNSLKVGVMIEVPSAAVTAEILAREVDFFSIGTNDLTQYTLAIDRGHPKLARSADALHPAVLRMIAMTVEGAHEHGKWVGVCGGIASDAMAVPVLVGLGVDELSVSVPTIASVKAALSRWSMDECTALATDVLRLRTAAEVRAFLERNHGEVEMKSAEHLAP